MVWEMTLYYCDRCHAEFEEEDDAEEHEKDCGKKEGLEE